MSLPELLDRMTGRELLAAGLVFMDLHESAPTDETRDLMQHIGHEVGAAVQRNLAALPPDPELAEFSDVIAGYFSE